MEAAAIIDINEATRRRILESASNRFSHYGYTKITMAEIADDCGMSAANLYRYFRNKQEIATACVSNNIQDRLDRIKNSIESETSSACLKLENLIHASLHYSHEIYAHDERIYELIGFITDEKPELVHYKIDLLQNEIKAILQFGNQTREFDVEDIDATASAIYTSIALFDTPIFMGFYSIDKFEHLANEVLQLILRGIKRR